MNEQIQIKNMTNGQLRTILESIQEELNEREWNAIATKPQNMKRMIDLARKARQEHTEEKTIQGVFGKD